MVGAVERHIALGMARRLEDRLGVLDPDRVVGGRMEHDQRLAETGDARALVLRAQIVEEALADGEVAAGKRDLGLALGVDLGNLAGRNI